MDVQSNCLFITFVEKEGPFLKVWGQTDKNTSLYIEQVLKSFSNQFDNGLCIPRPESLQSGILCCAKYKDNKYYRARITNLSYLHNRYIEVNFVDYGHKDLVPVSNIRSLEGFETTFISIQPQASSFLLAEAVCPRGEWTDAYLDEICKEIRYNEVTFAIVAQVTKHYLVRLFAGVNDVAIILISKGLMRHTSLTTQEAVLLSMMPRPVIPHQPMVQQQTFATYKAYTLEPGGQYEVYVSYVTEGPSNFSIQLKQSEEGLGKLMKEINSMTLTPMEDVPIPGTVCLARCVEDGHICRAVVTNEVDGQYKVFYVDFGNFEVVPLEAMYEIPFKFVIPKAMAIRFALAGVEKSSVTLDMQCAFKQFVDNRLMHMKVMPMTTRSALPRCELWDPETQTNVLDIVNQAASAGYPEPVSLNRGFTQPIKVSYVYSCNRFYVQSISKQDDLMRLMLDIQRSCKHSETLANNMIKVGMPCYALYEGDQQWYRSQIVEVLLGGKAKVRYVDYGNEEEVSISFLKPIEGKQLSVLRPQAIECCLNGYQNMEPDLERDNLLEELILEQEFTMKVIEMQGKKALIELIDASNYNVASLLLDKIATTRSQVSPMLVQAGNKIEHRKSSHPRDQPQTQDLSPRQDQRKPDRGQKQWGDSTNDNLTWRQDGRGPRNRNSYETNETDDSMSWRQNNKGFNKNYDRNDSTDSEKQKGGYHKNDRNRNDFNSQNADDNSWKQNNRSGNKVPGRFNRDSNRNDNWNNSEEGKESRDDWKNSNSNQNDWNYDNNRQKKEKNDWGGTKEKDDWSGGRDHNRQNYKSREKDDWGGTKEKDDWGGGKDHDRQKYKPRERDDWGGGTKEKDEWGGGKDHDRQKYKSREKDDWNGGKDGGRSNFKPRDRDDWGGSKDGGKQFNRKGRDEWDNKENRKNFSPNEDTWGSTESKPENNDWGNKNDRKGGDNFRKNKEGFRERSDDWGNTESSYKGGFKKKPDFKREKSELSSSGSEKSFRKGFKENFRNKPFNKKFDRSPKDNFADDSGGDAWNVSSSTAVEVPNAAPSTAKFTVLNVDNTESNVLISWFHNPTHFYCQLENTQNEFKQMMEQIRLAYKGRTQSSVAVGAPAVGLFPEDNVLYRAEILEKIGSQFKVYYVDFGNVSVIDKVWPIEMRFMELPAQAIRCKLDKIEPPSENWPDASNYTQYFDKNQFFCRFISTETDKVAVKLEYNGEDIASLLLKDGLAKTVVQAAPPELPLLIGQQFKAMLLTVNSLSDFTLCLQTGFLLNCSIFNLAESTETWESTLKEKLEQILIVYVDDVKEERLEVTLYDDSGSKLKLIDRDEEAYESVELLCPYLIQYSSLSGEITHVNENTIYIQPSDCAQSIEFLLNTLYEYYENTPSENPVTPVEGYVYAVKGSDTNWYRGRVTSLKENQATVNYLDYGNSEEVEMSVLRELILEFMDMQIMCVAVTIKNATEDLIGKFVVVDLTFTESGLEGTIQEEQEVVAAVTEEQDVVTAVEEEQAVPFEASVNETVVSAAPTTEQSGTLVVLSHADSPSDFYLQLSDSIEAIEQLQATLQEQIPEMPDMENPVVGILCAAPYLLDEQWYRAQVLDADADITTVRFVDYGNTDVLDNHKTHIKTLPPHLLALEVYATRCRLKIKPVDEEWTSAASERFEQLSNVEALTAQFISQDEKTNYVELFSNGQNIREVLTQENLALPDEIVSETSSVGFVSHLNSPSEFWIQLENCVDELEWVAEQLSGAENFSELEDLAPGVLCAALFPDDQMWYRARILSNTVAGIEVLFVDYGNSCTSCSLRELPEDLVMLPPLAQKCSLQKPEGLTSWGPGMIKRFSEISADGQTTFKVKKLSTGETAAVELLLDGVDVTTLLLPKTEEVRVKSFQGFDDMLLIKGDQELPSKYKLELLPDITWNEDSVKKFEEINCNGDTTFQAEFVSDDTVRLYLGLNDIRLELNGVKTTKSSSSPLKIRSERIETDTTHSDSNITEPSAEEEQKETSEVTPLAEDDVSEQKKSVPISGEEEPQVSDSSNILDTKESGLDESVESQVENVPTAKSEASDDSNNLDKETIISADTTVSEKESSQLEVDISKNVMSETETTTESELHSATSEINDTSGDHEEDKSDEKLDGKKEKQESS